MDHRYMTLRSSWTEDVEYIPGQSKALVWDEWPWLQMSIINNIA